MACTIDFRKLDEGFGGKTFKRKRAEQEAEKLSLLDDNDSSMDIDATNPSKRQAVESTSDPNKPSFGKPTYDGVIAGKVSGRKWKEVRTRRASAVHVKKGTNAEQRSREKEIKKAYRERVNELKEEIRQNKQEKRKQREEREKKKQDNILKSGTRIQKITNPKTLKEEIRQNKQEKRKQREEREKKKQDNILKSGTRIQKITNPKTLKKISKSKQRKQLKVVPDELFNNKNKKK